MTRLLAAAMVALTATPVLAHPGWGIVQDSRGNVFFTDTTHVWMIAPDGKVAIAVPRVHPHELCLDANDYLYGEHLWYEGDATGKWAHRVWRYRPDSGVTEVIPTRAGFRTSYSFVRDLQGNMYWSEGNKPITIRKRRPGGEVAPHAAGDFRSVERMAAPPNGTLTGARVFFEMTT